MNKVFECSTLVDLIKKIVDDEFVVVGCLLYYRTRTKRRKKSCKFLQ